MRRFLFLFLISTFCNSLFSQSQEALIDSLLLRIENAKDNEEKAHLMANVSFYYQHTNPKEGIRIAEEAEKLNPKAESTLFEIYNSQATNYWVMSNFTKAIEYYYKALYLSSDSNELAMINGNLGVLYMDIKDYEICKKHLDIAIIIDSTLNNLDNLSRHRFNLANLYGNLKEYDKSIALFWEVYEYYNSQGNEQVVALLLSNISVCYNEMNQYEEAMKFLYRAKSINLKTGNLSSLSYNYLTLGTSYFKALTEETKNKKPINRKTSKNYIQAKIYLDSAVLISDKLSEVSVKQKALNNLSELHDFVGNYEKAYRAYKESTEIKDSIFNQEKILEIARIESQQEIELLRLRESAALEKAEKENVQKTALVGVLGLILIGSFLLFRLYKKSRKAKSIAESERQRSEELLLNILPAEVADELKDHGNSPARKFNEVSILLTDFVNFSARAESMTPEDLVKELDICFTAFDKITEKYGLEKIKTIGDAYLAVSGLPVEHPDHAVRCCKAAIEIRDFIQERILNGGTFFVRIGIHSGPVIAGIVGLKKYAYDIWGNSVNFAARLEQNSLPGQITISERTYELLSGEADVTPRGEIELKNIGRHHVYFLNRL